MAPLTLAGLTIGSDPVPINPLGGTVQITNQGPGNLYYSSTNQPSSTNNDGTITSGSVLTLSHIVWAVCDQRSGVTLQITDGDTLSTLNWPFRL